jgi:hypothetical protein
MKSSTPWARQGRAITGRIALALVAAAVMVGISMSPTLGAEYGRRLGPQEHGRYAPQPSRRAHRPSRRAPQSYGHYYQPPVIYAPPPVYYAPPPSPGISLFFGFPIRIR